MVPMSRSLLLLTLCSLTAAAACFQTGERATDRAEVLAVLESYTAAARTVDPDLIAPHYTADAILFEPGIPPIVSRDSIHAFIASFPGVVVERALASADTVELHGGTAYLWGTYSERLGFPGQPTSDQTGRFVMQLVREADGAWRVRRLYRIPLQTVVDSAS